MFIDEFPSDHELILYLRNVARTICLPVVLAATNAKIGNMVGTNKRFGSRGEKAEPWVKLITKLPEANPFSLAKFCEFKCGEIVFTLENFLSGDSDIVDVERLMEFMRINCSTNDLNGIKNLFKLLFSQAKTCLPGIIFLIFQNLDEIFQKSVEAESATNFSDRIWKNICD